jgi:hypothetical protein
MNYIFSNFFIGFFFSLPCSSALPKSSTPLMTNVAQFQNPPPWLNSTRVNRIAANVTRYMEWSIRRVDVIWYYQQADFEKSHSLGPHAVAVTQRNKNRILLGPKVTEQNFDRVFGHELVHVTSEQKFKGAIPPWLEEGVANFIAKGNGVDYKLLKAHAQAFDTSYLSHPMSGSREQIHLKYQFSQALTEMIAQRCDIINLLRMSVQRRLEDYLSKMCRITDVKKDLQSWIERK